MRSASCSPHAVTHAAQPLQRSETNIEKIPPPPGFFFSGVAKMALVFWYAIGTLSMALKNCVLATSEKPFTACVTCRISCCGGVPAPFARRSEDRRVGRQRNARRGRELDK